MPDNIVCGQALIPNLENKFTDGQVFLRDFWMTFERLVFYIPARKWRLKSPKRRCPGVKLFSRFGIRWQ
jgi:hypothetical protein